MMTVISLILLSITVVMGYNTECLCSDSDVFIGYVNVSIEGDYLLSDDNVVISGVDYGKYIKVNGLIFLMDDVVVSSSISALKTQCPSGYRAPTTEEMEGISHLGYEFLVDVFSFNASFYYMTTEKMFPEKNNGGDNEAWIYASMNLNEGDQTVTMDTTNTYWNSGKMMTKCILDTSSVEIVVNGLPDVDLVLYQEYSLNINMKNIIKIYWSFGKEGTDVVYKPSATGCRTFTVFLEFFDGTVLSQCKQYWVEEKMGSDSPTTLELADLLSIDLGYKSYRTTRLHFSSGNAPIAPKYDGGAYILFAERDTNALIVLEIDEDLAEVALYDLEATGYTLDILALPVGGFVILAKDYTDPHFLYLASFSDDGTKLKQKTIMNNGPDPVSGTDQITFWSSETEAKFGMDACFRPDTGRLAYGRGRIAATYSHYNFFGYYDNGNRNVHTGDTLLTFDLNLEDTKLGWAWGASHSLTQRLFFDGKKFFQSALGDAYPENINFQFVTGSETTGSIDPVLLTDSSLIRSSSGSVIPGYIPGNGGGAASGRLGNIFLIDYNLYAVVYSRRGCVCEYTEAATNDINELAIVFFNSSYDTLNTVRLTENDDITSVRAVKFGSNILIGFTTTTDLSNDFLTSSITESQLMTMLLIDDEGSILTQPFEVPFSLNAGDDMEYLKDGRPIWTYINAAGNLTLQYLPVPQNICESPNRPAYCDETENTESDVIFSTEDTEINAGIYILSMSIALLIGLMN